MAHTYRFKSLIVLSRACELYKKLNESLDEKNERPEQLNVLEDTIKKAVVFLCEELKQDFLDRTNNYLSTLLNFKIEVLNPDLVSANIADNFIDNLNKNQNPATNFFDIITKIFQNNMEAVNNNVINNIKNNKALCKKFNPELFDVQFTPEKKVNISNIEIKKSYKNKSSSFLKIDFSELSYQKPEIKVYDKNNTKNVFLEKNIVNGKIAFVFNNNRYTIDINEFDSQGNIEENNEEGKKEKEFSHENIDIVLNEKEKVDYQKLFNNESFTENDLSVFKELLPKIMQKKTSVEASTQLNDALVENFMQAGLHQEFKQDVWAGCGLFKTENWKPEALLKDLQDKNPPMFILATRKDQGCDLLKWPDTVEEYDISFEMIKNSLNGKDAVFVINDELYFAHADKEELRKIQKYSENSEGYKDIYNACRRNMIQANEAQLIIINKLASRTNIMGFHFYGEQGQNPINLHFKDEQLNYIDEIFANDNDIKENRPIEQLSPKQVQKLIPISAFTPWSIQENQLNKIITETTKCKVEWMSEENFKEIKEEYPAQSRYILTGNKLYYQSITDLSPLELQNKNLIELNEKFKKPENRDSIFINSQQAHEIEYLIGHKTLTVTSQDVVSSFSEYFETAISGFESKRFTESLLNTFNEIIKHYKKERDPTFVNICTQITKALNDITFIFPLDTQSLADIFDGKYQAPFGKKANIENLQKVLHFAIDTIQSDEKLQMFLKTITDDKTIENKNWKTKYSVTSKDKHTSEMHTSIHEKFTTYFQYLMRFQLQMKTICENITKWNNQNPRQLIEFKVIQDFSYKMNHIIAIYNAIKRAMEVISTIEKFKKSLGNDIDWKREPFLTLNDIQKSLANLSAHKLDLSVKFDEIKFCSINENVPEDLTYRSVAHTLQYPKSDFIVSINNQLYYGSYLGKTLTQINKDIVINQNDTRDVKISKQKQINKYLVFEKKCVNNEGQGSEEKLTAKMIKNVKLVCDRTPYNAEECLALAIKKSLLNANFNLNINSFRVKNKEALNFIRQAELTFFRQVIKIKNIDKNNNELINAELEKISKDILENADYKTKYVQINDVVWEVTKDKWEQVVLEGFSDFDPEAPGDGRSMSVDDLEKIRQKNPLYDPWEKYSSQNRNEHDLPEEKTREAMRKLNASIEVIKDKLNYAGADGDRAKYWIKHATAFENFRNKIKVDLLNQDRHHYEGNLVLIKKVNKLARFLIDDDFSGAHDKAYHEKLKQHFDAIDHAVHHYSENNTPTFIRAAATLIAAVCLAVVALGVTGLILFLTGGLALPVLALVGIGLGAGLGGALVGGVTAGTIGFFKTRKFSQPIDEAVKDKAEAIPYAECNLIKMANDPTIMNIEQRKGLLKDKPAYILFENKIYYFDNTNTLGFTSPAIENIENNIFPANDGELQSATLGKMRDIKALTNHTPVINDEINNNMRLVN